LIGMPSLAHRFHPQRPARRRPFLRGREFEGRQEAPVFGSFATRRML
jgi:hypothetical protein